MFEIQNSDISTRPNRASYIMYSRLLVSTFLILQYFMLENVIQATLTVMNDDVIRRYIMFSIPFFL